jgi:hypothetical protein
MARPDRRAIVAGVLRFYRLGSPHAFVFDETYYAKDAWSLLQHGVELNYVKNANQLILTVRERLQRKFRVCRPPTRRKVDHLGWRAAVRARSLWWRFAVAILGTLSVLMIARIARRLTGSTVLGTAGLLLAVDGLHFVMSRRVARPDPQFFVLAAFGCLLIDRDRARERLPSAERMADRWRTSPASSVPARLAALAAARGCLPRLGDGDEVERIYAIVVLGILTFAWDIGARRAAVRSPLLGALRKDALPALGDRCIAVVVYAASWTGWFSPMTAMTVTG